MHRSKGAIRLLKNSYGRRWASSSSEGKVDLVERRLLSLFTHYGSSDYIGEPVSIAQHSIQAMLAAKNAGESKEIQLAALLHDIGHLLGLESGFSPAMDGCGTVDHEGVGADFICDLGLFSAFQMIMI